ncbi:MAG: aldehyde ferredoxin oxidoreductase family protein [Bacillota bacterium]
MVLGGYTGKVLRVDLTTGQCRVCPIPTEDMLTYIGGRGLAAKFLYDEVRPGTEPFSPENRLCIFTGPLTGTRIPFTAKYAVATKSPLTGGFTRSISGGYFPVELKLAGYDGLIISGRAEHPVYLWLRNEEVEIRDARSLWGLTVTETEKRIREELGSSAVRVATIGPAGEKLVRFASVMNDSFEAAARGGPGAVMGSKNLKAIAVLGRKPVPVADPGLLEETMSRAYGAIVSHPGYVSRLRAGVMETVPLVYRYNMASVRHYSAKPFSRLEAFEPRSLVERFVTEENSCFGCPHKCLKQTAVREGLWAGCATQGPKYETICMFGPNCDNDDMASIIKANEICTDYGLDTASAGNVVAFAMEFAERGLLTPEDFRGVPVGFGSGESLVHLLYSIVTRQGLGDLLAEGVLRASSALGRDARQLAMHVKGQEMGSFDPRGYPAMGLAYATSNRGACHMGPPFRLDQWWVHKKPDDAGRWATVGKARVVVDVQNLYVLLDSMLFCSFSRYGFDPDLYMTCLKAVTGWDLSWEHANELANAIYSLERSFNVREGFSAAHDTLPERFLQGDRGIPLEPMLREYYQLRGWDEKGAPKNVPSQ